MLDNNNHKNSTCAFAEQTVSYLYGEADAKEKTVFETHLNSCVSCAEEFAGFSAVHSSITEWRNEEFLSLEIPSTEIPYEKTREFYNAETDSKVSRSWLEELRKLFTLSPALTASASFAVIAVCVGIIFFANKSLYNVDVADIKGKNTEQIIASQKFGNENLGNTVPNENLGKAPGKISTDEQSKFLATTAKNGNLETIPESRDARKNSTVKDAADSRSLTKNLNREANLRKIKAASINNKKPAFAQTGKIPRLNSIEEEEDQSLRLAELFDDADAK